MDLLGEEADQDSRYQSFDRRAHHKSVQLIPDSRRKPGGQPVKDPQHSSKHQPKYRFRHKTSLLCFWIIVTSKLIAVTILLNTCDRFFSGQRRRIRVLSLANTPKSTELEIDFCPAIVPPSRRNSHDTRLPGCRRDNSKHPLPILQHPDIGPFVSRTLPSSKLLRWA